MKLATRILTIALLLLGLFGSGRMLALNPLEKSARDAMIRFLTERNYVCEIDPKDESLNFKYNGNLHWITFESTEDNMVLYTMHRAPLLMTKESDSEEKANISVENGVFAANLVTAKNPYKAFLQGKKIEFQFPTFASSPEEYQKVMFTILRSMNNSKVSFNDEMKEAQEVNDSIHGYWLYDVGGKYVLPADKSNTANSHIRVTNVEFQNVDKNGKVITPYGTPLYGQEMMYLMPKVGIQPKDKNKGDYILTVNIFTPDGRMMVRDLQQKETMQSIISVKKNDTQYFELPTVGDDYYQIWTPGIYIVQIFENSTPIYEQKFVIQ